MSSSITFGPNTEVRLVNWMTNKCVSTARMQEDGKTLQTFPTRKLFDKYTDWVTAENERNNSRLIITPEHGPAYANYTLPSDKRKLYTYEEEYADGYTGYAGYEDDGGFGDDGDGRYDDERRDNGYMVDEVEDDTSPAAAGGGGGGGGGASAAYLPGTKLRLFKDGERISTAVILKSGETFQVWPNRADPSARHYDTPEEWRASVQGRHGMMEMTVTTDAPAPHQNLGKKRAVAARKAAAGRRAENPVTQMDRINARLARLEIQLA